jgi:DNA polymerase-3 subunit gamma/tau
MYQVIARKYRPQSFSELIGQQHVEKTLVNAIESGRIAHGYIFSGQRGTGKTTVARILARCLNCINGPTASPCGVCSSCTEIAASNSVDVIEIDAASNRGINEMREIRENVRYRPARDRYKVFIIDEAHQITKEAFNALLKTLEEPPEWVVFILCTTEAYDIPSTIASRCQHFTFRSVDFQVLVDRMKVIAEKEGIQADEESLSVIAQAGEGSVRDSLSALDQAIACCGQALKVEDIRALLGVFGADALRAVATAVHERDSGRMIEIVQELESNGQSLHHFARELSRYWRNLLVAKIAGKTTSLISASEPEQQRFRETAALFSTEDLTRYLNLTLELYKDLQESLQPRLHLELGLVKLVYAGQLQPIEEAIASLGETPSGNAANPPVAKAAASLASGPRPATFQAPVSKTQVAGPVGKHETGEAPVALEKTGDLRQDLGNALRSAGLSFSADAVARAELKLEGGTLFIRAPKSAMLSLRDAGVHLAASQIAGRAVKVNLEVAEDVAAAPPPKSPALNGSDTDDKLRERALSHPEVKRFQELFPGAQVRAVRNLNE